MNSPSDSYMKFRATKKPERPILRFMMMYVLLQKITTFDVVVYL
jgi:hypothetical protein